jgi:hypothetical protein
LRNDWVDNLVSKEYKGNSAEISGKLYIYKKTNCSYEYISYILSLQLRLLHIKSIHEKI